MRELSRKLLQGYPHSAELQRAVHVASVHRLFVMPWTFMTKEAKLGWLTGQRAKLALMH